MSEPVPSQSLRERKKVHTRLAIRREAFRLFEKHGYSNTTIEQIAHAADVSPRTFYRYFGVKEALLLSDDQISPIVEAFVAAPSEMTIVEAYAFAVGKVFGGLTLEQREDAIAGQRMLYDTPEACGMLYTAYVRMIDLITEALTERTDAPAEEAERRVIASAIVGVLIGASHNTPLPEAALQSALKILGRRLS
ncbi:TetR/AcrR family transcriptional regulator [Mycobacterium sp. pW049]|uniref:TetR/AcrR family transcriptional regulator n=1 Tax=[Mycobacterium] bulgaricum TaxID=3238985 RepID=UPI00351B937A